MSSVVNQQLFFKKYLVLCKDYLAYIIVLAPLLADIFTGLIDVLLGVYLPFGVVVRALLLFGGCYLVYLSNSQLSRLILFISVFYLILMTYWLTTQSNLSVNIELKTLSLILLPFLTYHIFQYCNLAETSVKFDRITQAVSLYGLIASSSIIICFFLGIGYESYGDYAFGFKGVFISGNDIGIAIVLCSAVAWYRVCQNANALDVISAFSCFIGLLFIASRAGVVFGLCFLMAGVFVYLFFTKSQRYFHTILKSIIFVLVACILIVAAWLSIKFAEDILYHSVRLLELLDGVSPRHHLEYSAEQVFESLTRLDILFGQGWAFYSAIGEEHYLRLTLHYGKILDKNIEKDFHDLFGYTGIVFTLFYIGIIFFTVGKLISSYIRNKKLISLVSLVVFFVLIIHAIFAGHVIFGSQVPIIAATIIFLGFNYNANSR